MSKHTPGPWVVDTTLSSGEVMTANGYAIHEHPSYSSITDAKEIQANARLIAAAPDLANVVYWLIQEYETAGGGIPDGLYNAARKAIAKADGVKA